MSRWPRVALGEILQRSDEAALLDPDREYHELTIRIWGKGIVSRGKVKGSDVVTQRRFVRANQLVLSKIDARHGAIGLVPKELDGAIVSNDFPSFIVDENQVEPAFLGWLVRSGRFVELCKSSSEGTTNRVRIKEDRFLSQEIAFPIIFEQRTIVTRLDAVADKVRQVEAKLDEIEADAAALVISLHHKLADGHTVRLGDILELVEETEPVLPDIEYPQVGVRGFGGGLFAKPAIRGTDTTYRAFNRLYPDAIVLSQVKGWEGAVARCPEFLADFYVSPEYRTFHCIPNQASPAYLGELIKTPWFWSLLQNATHGVGARRERTRPEQFLTIELPMPLFQDQVKGIEVVDRLEKTKAKHTETRQALKALLPSMLEQIFRNHN